MQVGLVDVMNKRQGGNGPSVALAALAGHLARAGHEVQVLDLFHARRAERERFLGAGLGLVGISASSFDFEVARGFARRVHQRSGTPVVLGGPHASVSRAAILEEPAVDYAVYGEGELPLERLVAALEADRRPSVARLQEIEGLAFRDGEQFVVNGPQARLTDLDALPLPTYGPFPMRRYTQHHVSTSRGCPFGCAFCASSAILGRRWVAKSAERVVEEIEVLLREHGHKPVWIVDDSFNLDPERVKAFCRLLGARRLELSWCLMAGARADRMDLEMLRLMRETGCRDFGVGIESSDPQVLEQIGKGETIDDITRGIRLAHEAGFHLAGSFMIGNPGDTLASVRRSLEYAREQGLEEVFVYHALPFPHTRLWEWVEGHGTFFRRDFANFQKLEAEPIFETPEFPRADRIEAYRYALELFPGANQHATGGPTLWRFVRAFEDEWHEHGVAAALRRTGAFVAHRLGVKLPGEGDTRAPPA